MKVVAFNGSPRKGGNTEIMIDEIFEVLKGQGIETELIHLGAHAFRGCIACGRCIQNKDGHCAVTDDVANEYLDKAFGSEGIILGSPTYFADVTAGMKAFMERLGFVAFANGGLLRRRVGAAVVAVRRGGGTHVFDSINHLFQMSQMIVVGSTYWNLGIGLDKGDVSSDEEGMRNMRNLGENMAWAMKKLYG